MCNTVMYELGLSLPRQAMCALLSLQLARVDPVVGESFSVHSSIL